MAIHKENVQKENSMLTGAKDRVKVNEKVSHQLFFQVFNLLPSGLKEISERISVLKKVAILTRFTLHIMIKVCNENN